VQSGRRDRVSITRGLYGHPEMKRAVLSHAAMTMRFEWDDAALAKQGIAVGRAHVEREPSGWLPMLKRFLRLQ
jgi:hypothetical protein